MPSLEVVPFGPPPTWVEEAMTLEHVLVVCATEGERRHHLRRLVRNGGAVDAPARAAFGVVPEGPFYDLLQNDNNVKQNDCFDRRFV